ncbi:MAG TPA: SpoIIE family protein phosphatase [Actinomycetes bacterium]|nr:SpoIIE family protein phosphatase [Actinomycetes bacterium]
MSARHGVAPADVLETGGHVPAPTAMQVLLVEDDEGDAFLVEELLLEAGSDAQLSRVRTLSEALLTLPGDVDCVLLDLGLPDASGLDALERVLERAPSIAVLVLTGLDDEFRGTQAVAAGAQDYLVKGGIDGQLLTRAIRYAIERKRADESIRRLYASEARAAENARLERGLLPQPLLRRLAPHDVVKLYSPGRHQSLLGGDFYDVVDCDDGSVFALVGDVAGHGPDEAALGVCLRIAWRTLILAGADPATVFSSMHDVLVSERESDEVFATVAMVRVRPDEGVATTWLAGHPVPVLVEGTAVSPLPDHGSGVALGVLDDMTWPGVDMPVSRRSSLVLFTDGLIEGFDGVTQGRRLGDGGLHAVLAGLLEAGFTGNELAVTLLDEVRRRNGGELTDDVAVLMLSWTGWE